MDPETIRNETLAYLTEYYPQSLGTIPDQVLEFGLPNRVVTICFVSFIAILLVISVTGNSMMIFLYGRFKTLRTPANKLVINLAVANFIMHSKSWILITNGIDGGPVLGDIGCYLFGGCGTLSGLTEIWTITAIAYERCRAISTPLTMARKLNNTQVNCLIVFIWTLSLICTLLPAIGIGNYVADTYLLACVYDTWNQDFWNRFYVIGLIILAWFVPLVVIGICYLKIFNYTRDTRANITNHSSEAGASITYGNSSTPMSSLKVISRWPSVKRDKDIVNSDMFELEKKLATRLFLIIFIWLVGWTPFAIISIIQLFGYGEIVSKNFNLVAMLGCKLTSVLNAGLYGMRLPKFRKKILKLLSMIIRKDLAIMDSSTQMRKRIELYRQQTYESRLRNPGGDRDTSRKRQSGGVRFQLQAAMLESGEDHQEIRICAPINQAMKQSRKSLKSSLKKPPMSKIAFQLQSVEVLMDNQVESRQVMLIEVNDQEAATATDLALICRYKRRRSSL